MPVAVDKHGFADSGQASDVSRAHRLTCTTNPHMHVHVQPPERNPALLERWKPEIRALGPWPAARVISVRTRLVRGARRHDDASGSMRVYLLALAGLLLSLALGTGAQSGPWGPTGTPRPDSFRSVRATVDSQSTAGAPVLRMETVTYTWTELTSAPKTLSSHQMVSTGTSLLVLAGYSSNPVGFVGDGYLYNGTGVLGPLREPT